MNRILSQLARQPPKFFKVSYAAEYKTFIPNHVILDRSHPLRETQRRKAREKEKDGLWWRATTTSDLTSSSCVRTWSRRRLRQAVIEELKARGYDKDGKLIDRKHLISEVTTSKTVAPSTLSDLQGSLRLIVLPPIIPAKFVEIKAEVGKTLDIIIQAMRAEDFSPGFSRSASGRPQWKPPSQAQNSKPSSALRKRPVKHNDEQL